MRLALIMVCLLGLSISLRAADWSLEIVPTDVKRNEAAIRVDNLTPEFHVILTNISGRKMEIWKEWCSAGWYNLSFEVERADVTKFNLHKNGRGWSWNSPDPYLVLPHRSFVYSINLDADWGLDKVWIGFPRDFHQELVKLTAVFEERQDPDFESLAQSTVPGLKRSFLLISKDLWIGRVESAPFPVVLAKLEKPHN